MHGANTSQTLVSNVHLCPQLPRTPAASQSYFDPILPSTAFRVASIVNSNDSCGMLVTNGLTNHPTPVGISRVNDTTSLCT